MITARRLRERQAAGLIEAPPDPPPATVPYAEHQAAIRELRKAHAAELGKLQSRITELEAAHARTVPAPPMTAPQPQRQPVAPPPTPPSQPPPPPARRYVADAEPEPTPPTKPGRPKRGA